MRPTVTLAIDYGTTHTVAVLLVAGRGPQPLLFDGLPLLPSAVFCDATGRLHAGRDAERMAIDDPSGFEPNPKRHIDEPTVLLGTREIATPDLVAAVLGRVAAEAWRVAGQPADRVVLTHPAAWGPVRRQVLTDAAARVGFPPPDLVPEPVAAAAYQVLVSGRPLAAGRPLLVFDFGGGTLDVALVDRSETDGGFVVRGLTGIDRLGGVDIDAALGDYLRDPRRSPGGGPAGHERWLAQRAIRGAKETLARAESTQVRLPGEPAVRTLSRTELDSVVAPLVDRAVGVVRELLVRHGIAVGPAGGGTVPVDGPGHLAGILLVGGSSRVPRVAAALRHQIGVDPWLVDQPETVVARGAIALAAGPPAGAATSGVPVPGVPVTPVAEAPGKPAAPPATPTRPRRTIRRLVKVLGATLVVLVFACGATIGVARWWNTTDAARAREFDSAVLREFARPWLGLLSDCREMGPEEKAVERVYCDTRVRGDDGFPGTVCFYRYPDLGTRDAARGEVAERQEYGEDMPGDRGPRSGFRYIADGTLYWEDQASPVAATVNWLDERTPEELVAWWSRGK